MTSSVRVNAATAFTFVGVWLAGIGFGAGPWDHSVVEQAHHDWRDRTAVIVSEGTTDGSRVNDIIRYPNWNGTMIEERAKLPQALLKGASEHVVVSRLPGKAPWVEDAENTKGFLGLGGTAENPLKPSQGGPIFGGIILGWIPAGLLAWLTSFFGLALVRSRQMRQILTTGNFELRRLFELRDSLPRESDSRVVCKRRQRIEALIELAQERDSGETNVDYELDLIEQRLEGDITTRQDTRAELQPE